MLIAIEGIDGSGKATQTGLLARRLRREGKRVKTIAFPRHGHPAAWMVDQYLKGRYGDPRMVEAKASSIFPAVDRYDASLQIRSWLKQGFIVIADRYIMSSLAYSGAKLPPAKRPTLWKWTLDLEHNTLSIPRPNITIVLSARAEVTQRLVFKRSKKTGRYIDRFERSIAYLNNVLGVYHQLAHSLPNVLWIDCAPRNALLSKQAIHEKIWQGVCSNQSSASRSTYN